ncbi:macrophage migration inhibitory factor 2 [Elysia marginata]|uniref:D-dopachrome decarboxylase n=1 Tax=Elysia marginata TaxID=1093978 RepID=A0AAV4FN78_9GAST|nr:macrophage migration inhibitory factor 2 [Elysia marginata]
MPICKLYTSIKEAELKDGIELRIASAVAGILGKPLDLMTVLVFPGMRMISQSGLAPSCLLEITAINVFDKQKNRTYDQPLKQMLLQELGLPGERCMIHYIDLDPDFKV